MKIITGKPVSPGYARGGAEILGGDPGTARAEGPVAGITPDQVDAELVRFHRALQESADELTQLQARVASELGAESADIFTAHLLFLQDPQFIDRIEACVRNDQLDLASAIQVSVDELVNLLESADNSYLRERSADIRDLQRRLQRHISPSATERLANLAPESILVARELLPSDLLEFDREHLVGIITETGGDTGHAAILARALGIPAVTGITGATRLIRQGMPLLVDGQTGEVVLDPEQERIRTAIANQADYDRVSQHAADVEASECITLDGVRVHLLANIGRPYEAARVVRHHLEGVGLFRTEYLFLDDPRAPAFEHQREIYQQVAAMLQNRPLVIRTLDLGGDKWPAFLKPRFEANPNLGLRGLRFSLLAAEELFRVQIRAALHTARGHDIRIMLPMVLGLADLQHAISIIRDVAERDGISDLPPVGTLVETPAAVFAIEEILAVSDFVSIGTNDLTQFILAADRNALAMIDDYTVLHPSVLRAVQHVIRAADTAGKPVAVCGEAAADPCIACLLVGLGARRLSMSPASAARVRYAVRASQLQALERLAEAAMHSDSPQTVSALLSDTLGNLYSELCPTTTVE